MINTIEETKKTLTNLLELIEKFEVVFKENKENIEKMTEEQRKNMAKATCKLLRNEFNLNSLVYSMSEEQTRALYEELSVIRYTNVYKQTGFYYELQALRMTEQYIPEMVDGMTHEELKRAADGVAYVLVEKIDKSNVDELKTFIKEHSKKYDRAGEEVFKNREKVLKIIGDGGRKKLVYQRIRYYSDDKATELITRELDKFNDEQVKNYLDLTLTKAGNINLERLDSRIEHEDTKMVKGLVEIGESIARTIEKLL